MRKKKRFYARPFGFMSIQCEKCGDIRGFHSREELEYSRCRECDHKTFLTDLAPAVLHCKCGSMVVINTNMTDAIITITCPFCKAPWIWNWIEMDVDMRHWRMKYEQQSAEKSRKAQGNAAG